MSGTDDFKKYRDLAEKCRNCDPFKNPTEAAALLKLLSEFLDKLIAQKEAEREKSRRSDMGIFDLALNQSISCTVGTSAKPTVSASTLLQQFKKGSSNITEIADSAAAQIAAAVTAGTSGVVYIEFLG